MEDKAHLLNDYEQLRAYALSSIKVPSRPLALDLWLKKGFLSWIITMLSKATKPEPLRHVPALVESSYISADLLISIANILLEWSKQCQT